MSDARDAEDKRLLETGEIQLLLAGWVETIRGRCITKLRGPVGEDAAQAVCERLWRELKAGKHRDGRYPFRVIVHSVIGWVCNGWHEPGWYEHEFLEPDGADIDAAADIVIQVTLEQFVATLPPGDGEVAAALVPRGPRAGGDRRAARQEAERGLPGDQPEQGEVARVARGMKVELDTLLDELARRHARGEPLDVEGTLAKAGDRADELAPLIEAFLLRAPRRAPSDESLAYVRSLDDPPMTRARVAKALRVDDVVDAIVTACDAPTGGPPEGAPLLPAARRRHPRPVARRGVGVGRDHRAPGPSALDADHTAASTRCSLGEADVPRRQALRPGRATERSASTSEPDPPDEVDALFLGDPS